jgi:hypothetical protein
LTEKFQNVVDIVESSKHPEIFTVSVLKFAKECFGRLLVKNDPPMLTFAVKYLKEHKPGMKVLP